MILIVGLGNPGDEYANTRHSVGFMFVDRLLETMSPNHRFQFQKYTKSEIAKIHYNNTDLILAKPQTFMNLSGEAVQKLIANHKLPLTNLIVVHDDLDIVFGSYKIDTSVGPKNHNGILSIETHLKTKNFLRVRIGIDNRQGVKIPGERYVLERFTKDEMERIPEICAAIQEKLTRQNIFS